MKTYTDRKGRKHVVFPLCCTAEFCGITDETECLTCRNRKGLDKFRKWVDKHHAVAVPAIYNPTVFMELK
jgi:hypothetical protein